MNNIESESVICPTCGGTNTRRYAYGLMSFRSEEDERKFKETHILGGCEIDLMSPSYRCLDCKKDFGMFGDKQTEFQAR